MNILTQALANTWNKMAGPSTIVPGSNVNGVNIIEPSPKNVPRKKTKKAGSNGFGG